MIADRLKRKELANRRPLHTFPDNWIWDRNEVGEARKRVAAKRFIRQNSTLNPVDIRDAETPLLVTLAKTIKELKNVR
jgi:hypothetical protein